MCVCVCKTKQKQNNNLEVNKRSINTEVTKHNCSTDQFKTTHNITSCINLANGVELQRKAQRN